MPDDDVQLTDLAVIQQFSLAVRGPAATRSEVIAALEADLAYLNGTRRRAAPAPAFPSVSARSAPSSGRVAPRPAAERVPAKKPTSASATSSTRSSTRSSTKSPAKKPAGKSPVRKSPAKATRGRRG